MTAVALSHARLCLFSDPTYDIVIPHLAGLERPESTDGVLVRFDGDEYGTSFRGEGKSASFDVTCWYASGEHDRYFELLQLLRYARDTAVDDRLVLRTHLGQVPGLDGSQIVVQYGSNQTPNDGGLTWSVPVTFMRANGSFAV